MQKFWYNSPVKFFRIESEFEDVLNPQNIQAFGEIKPYTLEKGVFHRYLIPEYNNETDFLSNFSLFVVSNFTKTQIPCDVGIFEGKIKYITFLSTQNLSGILQLQYGSDVLYQSSCVRFADTEQSGIRQARVITKHNYNRQLFDFEPENCWFVTNLPMYENGYYAIEAEISNKRIGGISTLQTSETYLDEVVNYEIAAGGNGDILNFIQANVTNTEFYLNGTKRTSIDKLDVDDNSMFGKIKFTNVKDENGFNITIDEDIIFSDLNLDITNLIPSDDSLSSVANFQLDNHISITLNKDFKINQTKKVTIYKDGVLYATKLGSQLTVIGNEIVINDTILNPSDLVLDIAAYYILFEYGLVYTDFGKTFSITNPEMWNFEITENTQQIDSISWIEGGKKDKTGIESVISTQVDPDFPEDFSVANWQYYDGSDFVNATDGFMVPSYAFNTSNGINQYRWFVVGDSGTEYISNVLKYTKSIVPILKSVTKINTNTGRFVWNNNGIDYGSGSDVFQLSTDNGLNWISFYTGIPGSPSTDNTLDISSVSLSSLPNNTGVKFRIISSGNGLSNQISNTVEINWNASANIYITNEMPINGKTTYKLHVEGSDFIGFANAIGSKVNIKNTAINFTPYGSQLRLNIVEDEASNSTPVSIPVGIYNCSITTGGGAPIVTGVDTFITGSISYSFTPNFEDGVATVTVNYTSS